jgi:acyl-CoA synthetase (AMP-forming)/AMP-acid ligase II
VEGRLKELIVRGAENVAPLAVEQALLTHPAVAAAAVTGRPDPERGRRSPPSSCPQAGRRG